MSDETPGAGHSAQPPREGPAPRPSIRFPQVAGGQYFITTTSAQPRAIPALSQLPGGNATPSPNVGGPPSTTPTLATMPRIITISPSRTAQLVHGGGVGGAGGGPPTLAVVAAQGRPSLVNKSIVSALVAGGRMHQHHQQQQQQQQQHVRTQLFPVAGVVGGGNATIIGSPNSTTTTTTAHYPHHLHTQPPTTSTPRSSPLKRPLPPHHHHHHHHTSTPTTPPDRKTTTTDLGGGTSMNTPSTTRQRILIPSDVAAGAVNSPSVASSSTHSSTQNRLRTLNPSDTTTTSTPSSSRQRIPNPPSDTATTSTSSTRQQRGSTLQPSDTTTSTSATSHHRQLVLNHHMVRGKVLRERYNEHVLECYFTAAGGQILDLYQFAKRPRTQQYANYVRERAIDPGEYETTRTEPATTLPTTTTTPLPTKAPPPTLTTSSPTVVVTAPQPPPPPAATQASSLPGSSGTTAAPISSSTATDSNSTLAAFGSTGAATSTPMVVGDGGAGGLGGGGALLPDDHSSMAAAVAGGRSRTATPQLHPSTSHPPTTTTPTPASTTTTTTTTSSHNQQEQIVEKAKQEAYVVQRISELQKEGLWPERRLPKVQEMARAKAHWDYLLEEMVWLAADFAQERKWKKAAAKKCARMVQKYFQDKAAAAQKAEKAHEQHLRRVAAFCAKEIRNFWTNVEKLVEYKQHTRLEEKRKKALDQHLSFIVDQTEKYSQLLAEGMNKIPAVDTVATQSITSSNPVSRVNSDDEFQPSDEHSTDDEETIALEEAAAVREDSEERVEVEVAKLQRESEMDFEAFLSELPKDYLVNRDKIRLSDGEEEEEVNAEVVVGEDGEGKGGMGSSSSTSSNAVNERRKATRTDTDFIADSSDSPDDEDTLLEQETHEGGHDPDELDHLNQDTRITIEELRTKYANLPDVPHSEQSSSASASDSDDSDSVSESEGSDVDVTSSSDGSDVGAGEGEVEVGLKSLIAEDDENQDDLINDAAAIAESIQPKGNTLSSTSVVTKIPFLLKFSLREYQHIGLDWLVTMFERKLNGILADEMGLGKTIQTIALLAHLACEKENWGPHLIVVPTSVMLNWEMECKKWCPGFKILTYYGTQKERKQKRTGWTKTNAFHICITSYKLVIQDHQSFRRKKWKYLILDEAQNIKNFKSQRWQLLLNFQTQQRLLLTGTPLQNNLMELWSLMHFLMPNVFQSHREFKEWFSNPVTGMIEGNNEYNENIIKRLHKVLRPFLLRRLKCEVEKQMPKKYEHVVMCRLSKRQRFLYDDYMSRAKTRETLASGNLLSVINVLMQLRKVCNHPNLFEVRPTISPFHCEGIVQHIPSIVYGMLDRKVLRSVDVADSNYNLLRLERTYSAYQCYRLRQYCTPRTQIASVIHSDLRPMVHEPPHGLPEQPFLPPCTLALRVHVQHQRIKAEPVADGEEEEARGGGGEGGKGQKMDTLRVQSVKIKAAGVTGFPTSSKNTSLLKSDKSTSPGYAQLVETSTGKHILLTPTSTISTASLSGTTTVLTSSGQKLTVLSKQPVSHRSKYYKRHFKSGIVFPSKFYGKMTSDLDSDSFPTDDIEIDARKSVGTRFIDKLYSDHSHKPKQEEQQQQHSHEQHTTDQPVANDTKAGQSPKDGLDVRWDEAKNEAGALEVVDEAVCCCGKNCDLVPGGLKRSSRSRKVAKGDVSSLLETSFESDNSSTSSSKCCETCAACKLERTCRERDAHEKTDSIYRVNRARCHATPVYGTDLRGAVCMLGLPRPATTAGWQQGGGGGVPSQGGREGSKVQEVQHRWRDAMDECLNVQYGRNGIWCTSALREMVGDGYEGLIDRMTEIFNRYIVYVPAVRAPEPELQIWHPAVSRYWGAKTDKQILTKELFEPTKPLHPIASAMVTQFPHPRLIQYDCGKLQTLDRLLRTLKVGAHRVLIFTQMTKMLDVLEAFLNFHGHIYLRLDGTTRVDQRQMLMERFNGDKRIFVFILSTRSGGVGVNLTGADTVIFYDSDWNPTMDAQAQDRCHRIGQTRDVHIYRLVSERTIEENILKKANQKRLLGDLAIEGGNFTTAYFKSTTIQDLFTVDPSATSTAQSRITSSHPHHHHHLLSDPTTTVTTTILSDTPPPSDTTTITTEKTAAMCRLESALAAAEDDQDVIAARTAQAEAVADLAEFDENIPLEEVREGEGGAAVGEVVVSRAEMEVENIVKQLTPIERYAMKFIEETEAAWSQAQLEAAEREIEARKREWEENRLAAMRDEAERRAKELQEEQHDQLTFPRDDAINQVSNNKPHKGKTNAQNTKKVPGRKTSLNAPPPPISVGRKVPPHHINTTTGKRLIKRTKFGQQSQLTRRKTPEKHKLVRKKVADSKTPRKVSVETDGNKPTKKSMETLKDATKTEHDSNKPVRKSVIEVAPKSVSKLSVCEDDSNSSSKISVEDDNPKAKVKKQSVIEDDTKKAKNNEEDTRKPLRKYERSRKVVKKVTVVRKLLKKGLLIDGDLDDSKKPIKKPTVVEDGKKKVVARNLSITDTDNKKSSYNNKTLLVDDDKAPVKKPKVEVGRPGRKPLSIMADDSRKSIKKLPIIDDEDSSKNKCSIVENIVKKSKLEIGRPGRKPLSLTADDSRKPIKKPIIEDEDSSNSLFKIDEDSAQSSSITTSMDTQSYDSSDSDINRTLVAFNSKGHNSPRTRSRGTVAINLWTLDVSPILPGTRALKRKNDEDGSCSSTNEEVDSDEEGIQKDLKAKKNNSKILVEDTSNLRRGRSRATKSDQSVKKDAAKQMANDNCIDSDWESNISADEDEFESLIGTNVTCSVVQESYQGLQVLKQARRSCIKRASRESGELLEVDVPDIPPKSLNTITDVSDSTHDLLGHSSQNGTDTEENHEPDLNSTPKSRLVDKNNKRRDSLRLKRKTLSPKLNRTLSPKSPKHLRRPLIKSKISPQSHLIARNLSPRSAVRNCKVVMEDIATTGVISKLVQGNLSISIKRRIPIRSRRRINHNSNSSERPNTLDAWLSTSNNTEDLFHSVNSNVNDIMTDDSDTAENNGNNHVNESVTDLDESNVITIDD